MSFSNCFSFERSWISLYEIFKLRVLFSRSQCNNPYSSRFLSCHSRDQAVRLSCWRTWIFIFYKFFMWWKGWITKSKPLYSVECTSSRRAWIWVNSKDSDHVSLAFLCNLGWVSLIWVAGSTLSKVSTYLLAVHVNSIS